MDHNDFRYAWNGDTSLAYQVIGSGPVEMLYLQGFLSNLELNWEHPACARFLRALSSRARLVVSDRRGLGISERFTPSDTPPIEVLMDDVAAVQEAAGLQRPVLFATGDCGYVAALYAATYPGRLAGLVLYGTSPTEMRSDDTPWGITQAQLEAASVRVRDELGSGAWIRRTNPSLGANERDTVWGGRYERLSLTPGSVYYESLRFGLTDLRGILATILVPTLVVHRTGDPEVPVDAGRYLAAHIPGARFAELAGGDHFPWVGDQDAVLRALDGFVESIRREQAELDRVLATVMFTDIVGSTQRAAELGDRVWKDELERHRRVIRSLLDRYQGREVVTTGDGFLATFDGPARAVRCAVAAVQAVQTTGLKIRAGCHTGEIELMADDVGGIAVHIAARVCALAGPSEVLVSRTVRDLVVGSGLSFEDRGVHTLKGIPEDWQVYAVAASA